MRYCATKLEPVYFLTEDEAIRFVSCESWLRRGIERGYLKPIVQHKTKRYSIKDLERFCDMVAAAGSLPE